MPKGGSVLLYSFKGGLRPWFQIRYSYGTFASLIATTLVHKLKNKMADTSLRDSVKVSWPDVRLLAPPVGLEATCKRVLYNCDTTSS